MSRGGGFELTSEIPEDVPDENLENSSDSEPSNLGSGSEENDVKSDTTIDLGVYTEEYWISDYDYMSGSLEGSGLVDDPYIIDSAEDLALLSYNVFIGIPFSGMYFKQTSNIDLSDYYWMPIGGHDSSGGSTSCYFGGDYDGGGYYVSEVNPYYGSASTTYSYAGLFGRIYGSSSFYAKIHDLSIKSSTIKGYTHVGGLVGYQSSYSTIYNCFSEATVTGSSYYVGGISGYGLSYISIYNCYNTGTVTSSSYAVGGIIGYANASCTLYACYNMGDVTGTYRCGGILGYLSGTSYCYNCFNVGNITATSSSSYTYIGGIVGYLGSTAVTVGNCYHGAGTVLGYTTTYTKGIGGTATDTTTYLSTIATSAMTQSWFTTSSNWNSSYAWDFSSTWSMPSKNLINCGFPILSSFSYSCVYTDEYWTDYATNTIGSASAFSGGDGTESNPYQISSEIELANLSAAVFNGKHFSGVYFELTCGIVLSDHYWMPIGGHYASGCSATRYFSGDFNGNGYTIDGVDTSYATSSGKYSYMGMFGYVYGSSSSSFCNIHDVHITASTIIGYYYVGGIVGYARGYIQIYNCHADSEDDPTSVTGYSFDVGGIVGGVYGSSSNYRCKIYNCYSRCTVTGSSYHVGGIVGYIYRYADVYNCYNTDAVTGSYDVGGIVGNLGFSSSYSCYVFNCFNVGNVKATNTSSTYNKRVGGIVGYSVFSSAGYVNYCYYGSCYIYENTVSASQGVGTGSDSTTKLKALSDFAKTISWFYGVGIWKPGYSWDFLWTWKIDSDENDGFPILESSVIYDDDEDYWYFEDGYLPQSAVANDEDEIEYVEEWIASNSYKGGMAEFTSTSLTISITSTMWAEVYIFEIYGNSYRDDSYAYVEIYSESSGFVGYNLFVVEPIRWILSYGSEQPTSVSTAVTAQVVMAGQVTDSSGVGWSARRGSIVQTLSNLSSGLEIELGSIKSWTYDSFTTTTSQAIVNDETISASSVLTLASAAEIDALGGSYAAICTDFVAFLLSGGESTTGGTYTSYWTRDLAASMTSSSTYYSEVGKTYTYSGALNNGVYVTSGGTLSNSKLKNVMGARLSMSV